LVAALSAWARPAGALPGPCWAIVLLAAGQAFAGAEKPLECPAERSLCIQADRSGRIDLKTGTAVLEGNVLGYIKAQDLNFSAEVLKAYRNEQNDWTRLVLDRAVRLKQPDTLATADHSVLHQERTLLFGNGRVERPPYNIEGDEIELEDASRRITVRGSAEKLTRVIYRSAGGEGGEQAGDAEAILIAAVHTLIDSSRNEIQLTGQASVVRPELDWRMEADSAMLQFTEDRRLRSFRAEGNVSIRQPGRILKSDIAMSQNNNETILLIGNARVEQEGEFQLSSDRLEVYTDAKKGVVQSQDRQKPIKLEFNIASKEAPYRLDSGRLETLRGLGIPHVTLGRLEPLLGNSYATRTRFESALRETLTELEAERYLETIVAHGN
jgi:lipopolysaccharide export system protein LptA